MSGRNDRRTSKAVSVSSDYGDEQTRAKHAQAVESHGAAGWTDERVTTLKRLWTKGLSASQVARHLGGVSRSAVIGKVHRLHLPVRPSFSRPKLPPPARKRKRADPKPLAPIKPTHPWSQGAPKPPQNFEEPDMPGTYQLLDLKAHQCRWPIGDPSDAAFGFCGAHRAADKPYCAKHCFRAYTSSPTTSRELARSLRRYAA